jgi:two-component system, OmpR family, sensor histidine kinase KdpD
MVTVSGPERIVVALTGGPEGQVLLRRAAGIAARSPGAELHSVYVVRPGPGGASDPAGLLHLRRLTEDLGGTPHTVTADDPAGAVLDLARGLGATQVVVGQSRHGRVRSALRAGVSERVVAQAGELDVLMVGHPYARGAPGPRPASPLGTGRRVAGWLLAVGGPLLLTAAVGGSGEGITQALAYLALTVLCALVGGLWPALVAAVLGSLLLNWFFTPPRCTLSVADVANVVALVLFLVVAVAVASVVDAAARRSVQADLARREADALSMLNRALLRTGHGVDELLELVCETFDMTSATLLRATPSGWAVVAARGADAPLAPEDADAASDLSQEVVLLLGGRPLPAYDLRVLSAFATHLAVVLERAELAEQAAAAELLVQGNRMRTALLAAVSHDLRTPLAGIKAAVTTLRTPDVRWSAEDQDGLLGAIEDSADRLASIIANLLDMSRLQTGGVTLVPRDVGLDDVVVRALAGLADADRVRLVVPDDLPAVRVDAGLLERVVANLVDNALRHTRSPVEVRAAAAAGRVRLHVVDHGPGVPDASKPSLFEPFQRLGDAPAGEGVGLGLAVARGLTEAMGGTLTASDTASDTAGQDGGLTMTVELPAVAASAVPELQRAEP